MGIESEVLYIFTRGANRASNTLARWSGIEAAVIEREGQMRNECTI